MFEEAASVLAAVREAESAARRSVKWTETNDIPRDRVCPICRQQKIGPRQWIKGDDVLICLSCHRRCMATSTVPPTLAIPRVRYEIDGPLMRTTREDAGITLSEFARRAGWNKGRQSQLEQDISIVSPEVMEGIIKGYTEVWESPQD